MSNGESWGAGWAGEGAESGLGRGTSRPGPAVGQGEVGEGREDSRRLVDVNSLGKWREEAMVTLDLLTYSFIKPCVFVFFSFK